MKMKTKISKKLIVSTLSTAMGVSLVGAITGTVAWYQYSTRSTVSFVGTTIRNSENLQVSFDEFDDFENDLTAAEIAAQIGNTQLLPITTGAIEKDAALPAHFYANPIYQRFEYSEWLTAEATSYVQFTVYLRLNKIVNNDAPSVIESPRKVYLGDLVIQDDQNNPVADISEAIRVHIHSDHEDMLLAKNSDDMNVFGSLDLNGDDRPDTVETIYSFTDMNTVHTGVYGLQDAVQEKYVYGDVQPGVDGEGLLTGDHYLGTLYSKKVVFESGQDFADGVDYFEDDTLETPTEDAHAQIGHAYYIRQDALPVTITIWLEGWQQLRDIKRVTPAANHVLNKVYYTSDDLAAAAPANTVADGSTKYYLDEAVEVVGNVGDEFATLVPGRAVYEDENLSVVTLDASIQDGKQYYVAKEETPANGLILNDGVVYYSDINCSTLAEGTSNGTTEYYLDNGMSAMWDAVNYATAKFDVGLMFEVDA